MKANIVKPEVPQKKGTKLVCQRCGRGNETDPLGDWMYKGDSEYYATCPRCHSTVKIPRKEED